MTHVDGYSKSGAIHRAPTEDTQAKIAPHVRGLNELGVKGDSNFSIATNFSNAMAIKGGIKSLSAAKANSILQNLSLKALSGDLHQKLHNRLSQLDDQQTKTLKGLLHYSAKEAFVSKTDSEDRMVIRTALILAFSQGSDFNELTQLRSFLNGADAATRGKVLESLNRPDSSPTQVLQHFSGATPDAMSDRIAKWANAPDAIHNKVSEFINANPEYASCSRTGATALTAYSLSIYKQVNVELRSNGPLSENVTYLVDSAKEFMAQLPDFRGIVCRGGGSGWQEAALENYKPGAIVTEPTFVSTSPDCGFSGSIQFVIESLHGKEISKLSLMGGNDGREVLFAPGTKFEVIAVEHGEETYSLQKLPGKDPKEVANQFNVTGPDGNEVAKTEKLMFIIMREVE